VAVAVGEQAQVSLLAGQAVQVVVGRAKVATSPVVLAPQIKVLRVVLARKAVPGSAAGAGVAQQE
jgi:hypothetical protein